MGATVQETENETSISNSISISVDNAVANNVNNTANCTVTVDDDQDIKVGACAEFECGGAFTITQTARKIIKCLQENSTEIKTTMSNDITAAIDSAVDQAIEQKIKGTTIGYSSQHTKNKTDIHNEIDVNIRQDVENTVGNTLDAVISGSTTQGVEFNGKVKSGEECNMTQESITESISSQIADTLLDTLQKNKVVVKILSKYKLTMTQESEGFDLNKFFSDLFDVFNNALDGILPGGVIKNFLKYLLPIAIVAGLAVVAVFIAKAVLSKKTGSDEGEIIEGEF